MALMLQHSNRIRKLFSGSSCSSNVLETARTYYQNSLACCHVRAARGGSNLQSKKHFSLSVLSTLPEYKAAVDHDRLGNFPQAFPLYQRAHEVLSSSTGVGSDMSIHVAMQLAKSYMHAAQYNQAEKVLSVPPFTNLHIDGGNTTVVVKAQHLMSTLFLLKGDAVNASAVATAALDFVEGQDSSKIDITSYSACYGYKGLSHYFNGEMDDAEQFLQMAARWSQTPAQNAVALNNLGTLSWTRLGISIAERSLPSDGVSFVHRDSSYFNNKCQTAVREEGAKGVLLSPSELLLLQEALNYWEEAAEECTNEKDESSNAQQVAAAMCGANIPLGDISMPTLSVPPNPLGMEVRSIPKVSTSKTVNKSDKTKDNDAFLNRLKDVNFAMNYANILCNIAVGRCLLAADQFVPIETAKSDITETTSTSLTPKQYEDQASSEIKKNMDILSSAVKALETHIADTTHSANDEVNSNLRTNAVIIAPVLGRALGQLGKLYLNPFRGTHPEPVFAEGLFRAALDKLNGPFAVKDKRFLFERAVVTRDYGELLTKWEKREEAGADMMRDAEIIFDMLPKLGGSQLMFTSMILLPMNLHPTHD